jgi:hypothetical protein
MLKVRVLALSVVALAFFVVCGGGVNEAVLTESQARIDALRDKGVPAERLSMVRVHLHAAREHYEKNNNSLARRSLDSMRVHLETVESFYKEQVSTLGPTIDAAMATAGQAKRELVGFQVRKIDSITNIVDSFRRMNWLLQANNTAQELVGLIPALREDERKAASIRNRIPGEWMVRTTMSSAEHPEVNAVKTRVFRFGRPSSGRLGTIHLTEGERGFTGPHLFVDYEFNTWGEWDLKGDTIMLVVNRLQATRQNFRQRMAPDGPLVDQPQTPFDSTIGPKDKDRYRFILWSDLEGDFTRRR